MTHNEGALLAVFLGNPGAEYSGTRHNAGRLLAAEMGGALKWQKKFSGLYAPFFVKTESGEKKSHFLMPETFMNNSGISAAAAASFFNIPASGIIVVHDELEFSTGEAAFKYGGGLGGHNGLRSIKERLGTADFWRLRLGIGRPGGVKEKGQDISGWVLSAFSKSDRARFNETLVLCAAALETALKNGPGNLPAEWAKKFSIGR
ncbi:MAG: aminoacyl-tRNA hydrolase [Spirochaetaceae bacterium]|jgi:PTH1 family peptidyl-tRNA hydrolase|nr:aminoacyl-tRNA hydrolase [Spirochaetaceae bacterium]